MDEHGVDSKGQAWRVQFSERLRSLRGGHTQDEFARKVGIHKITWHRYEKGDRLPDVEALHRLALLTGVDLNWLVSGEGTAHPLPLGSELPDREDSKLHSLTSSPQTSQILGESEAPKSVHTGSSDREQVLNANEWERLSSLARRGGQLWALRLAEILRMAYPSPLTVQEIQAQLPAASPNTSTQDVMSDLRLLEELGIAEEVPGHGWQAIGTDVWLRTTGPGDHSQLAQAMVSSLLRVVVPAANIKQGLMGHFNLGVPAGTGPAVLRKLWTRFRDSLTELGHEDGREVITVILGMGLKASELDRDC